MKLRLLISTLCLAIGFAASAQITAIGLVGPAASGNWDNDVDLAQDATDTAKWSAILPLTVGECKIRANDAWALSWGNIDFPTGTGISANGPNISIPYAGDFLVTFNTVTAAYSFSVITDIGIIGPAASGNWDTDVDLYRDASDTSGNSYITTMSLTMGPAKFRLDNGWATSWGAPDFPIGIGLTSGGGDIPIPAAGKYIIKFNKLTGAYSFEEKVDFATIGLVGSATPSGSWNVDTNLVKDAANPDLWKADMVLQDGFAKFRANDAWAVSWGDTTFPSGIGTIPGKDIPVVAGEYRISFNTKTGAYEFKLIVAYTSMGIIGDATGLGWNTDVPMDQDAVDKTIWRKRFKFPVTGEAKFRANGNWDNSWGASGFPSDTALLNETINIPVPAGEYKVVFSSATGIYNFEKLIVYDTIGLTGDGISGGAWGTDVYMTKKAGEDFLFYIPSIDLIDAPSTGGVITGGVKFRADHDWKINWGAINWPAGTGTQNGHNIECLAGTYGVSFNTASGEYAFGDPIINTENLFTADAVALAPNPASDFVLISTEAKELTGDARIVVFNSLGARVLEQNVAINGSAKLNTAGLKTGNYFVQISVGKHMVGKSLVVIK